MAYNMLDFSNEEQDPKMIEKICTRMNDLLSSDEKLLYIAVQKKPAVNLAPDSIAITDKRLFLFCPKSFGFLLDFEEYPWRNIVTIKTKETFFGADFLFETLDSIEVKVNYLPKQQARKLYQLAQQQKENDKAPKVDSEIIMDKEICEEKTEPESFSHEEVLPNESVELVEAVEIINPQETQEFFNVQEIEDPIAALQKLKYLLNNGLITQQDFDNKKASILARM